MADENERFFLLTKVSFKQADFFNLLEPFYIAMKEYYHTSKQHYVERKLDYTKFVTIVRQLCKAHQISFTSKIIYNQSKYEINYYIYKPLLVKSSAGKTPSQPLSPI